MDSLDTLVVVGELEEFEKAVKLVVSNIRFDADLVVSVFETNIRMVGGLLSGNSNHTFFLFGRKCRQQSLE